MSDETPVPLDLDAYFRRIRYTGDRAPTLAVLENIHFAHTLHIPFENLDILLGRPIRIDLGSIQAKLVRGGRGGYCFEQNTLLAAVLEELGFRVTRLAARVCVNTTRVLPRSHKLLEVEVNGEPWLADVGFGSAGLLRPIPLKTGEQTKQFAWTYRLIDEPGLWVLQLLRGREWHDLYAFRREPQVPVDFEVANHYVSTHPHSRFVQTLTVQRSTPEARYKLVNQEFSIDRGAEVVTRTLADDAELLGLLAETFGLHFPAGTRFRSQADRLKAL